MLIPFSKYHGTGNDFILIDQRVTTYLTRTDQTQIAQLCARHFGIGADGLMLLQSKNGYDFEMIYFNSDGRESTLCGNGGRCIVAFAQRLQMFEQQCRFWAIDGVHEANIQGDWVELRMNDVQEIQVQPNFYFMNTGSPHYVQFVENIQEVDVVVEGRKVRYTPQFQPNGTNVNFVQVQNDFLQVATYERGVEDETLSCGTGVTAAAVAYYLQHPVKTTIPIRTKGGQLQVRFVPEDSKFTNVWLCGPTKFVFSGIAEV